MNRQLAKMNGMSKLNWSVLWCCILSLEKIEWRKPNPISLTKNIVLLNKIGNHSRKIFRAKKTNFFKVYSM